MSQSAIDNVVGKVTEEVKTEIDLMARTLPATTRIFLADGDELNLSTDYMVIIVDFFLCIFLLIPLLKFTGLLKIY